TAVWRQPLGSFGGGTRPMPRGYANGEARGRSSPVLPSSASPTQAFEERAGTGRALATSHAAADHAAVPALTADRGAAAVRATGAVGPLDDSSSDHGSLAPMTRLF